MKYIALEHHPNDSRLRVIDEDVCQTLQSRMGTGGGNVPIVLIVNDQGGDSIGWSREETAPTLRAESHQHLPIVVIENESENTDRKTVL